MLTPILRSIHPRSAGAFPAAASIGEENLSPARREVFCEDAGRHRHAEIAEYMWPDLPCTKQQHHTVGSGLPLGVGQRIDLELVRICANAGFGKIGIFPRLLAAALDVDSCPGLAGGIGNRLQR